MRAQPAPGAGRRPRAAALPFAYAPGSSRLHRLGAVPKVLWLAAAIVFCLTSLHPVPLGLVLLAACGLALVAGAGGQLARAIGLLGPIGASIVVLQVAAPAGCGNGCTVLAAIGPLPVTAEALARGIAYVLRLLALASVAVVALATTRPADLFGALQRLRVPHAAALVLSTATGLVPLLARELDVVLDARRARGLSDRGLRALGGALLPVFVAAYERTGRLAVSMEARGYGAGIRRTSYRTGELGPGERILSVLGAVAILVGAVAGLALWGPGSVQPLAVPAWLAIGLVAAAALGFAALLAGALASLWRA